MKSNIKLTDVMHALYASEINCSISCFWDGGWDVKLGDGLNGFKATIYLDNHCLDTTGVEWLIEKAVEFYPNSRFAKITAPLLREQETR